MFFFFSTLARMPEVATTSFDKFVFAISSRGVGFMVGLPLSIVLKIIEKRLAANEPGSLVRVKLNMVLPERLTGVSVFKKASFRTADKVVEKLEASNLRL